MPRYFDSCLRHQHAVASKAKGGIPEPRPILTGARLVVARSWRLRRPGAGDIASRRADGERRATSSRRKSAPKRDISNRSQRGHVPNPGRCRVYRRHRLRRSKQYFRRNANRDELRPQSTAESARIQRSPGTLPAGADRRSHTRCVPKRRLQDDDHRLGLARSRRDV